MSGRQITIVDFGMGNLLSVIRAVEFCGAKAFVTTEPSHILNASRLILPGVGAFRDGMRELGLRNLVAPIRQYCKSERPLIGICLGMQMLFTESDEFGKTDGLDLIRGKVTAIPNTGINGEWHKVPHIGWNELFESFPGRWKETIFRSTRERSTVYFVHSYTATPENTDERLADTYYHGRLIAAAVQKGNILGCQFHPEKSGTVGLGILSEFING